MTEARPPCPMTLTAGGPCPGGLFDSGIPGMDQCSYCGTWVGKPPLPPFELNLFASTLDDLITETVLPIDGDDGAEVFRHG